MKKLMLSIVVLVTASTFAFGQDAGFSPIELGVKAGANMTNISGQSFSSAYNLNYLFGAYLTLNLSHSIGIQPELEFTQVSATTTSGLTSIYADFGPSVTQNPHLNYMSIPVLLNLGGSVMKIQLGPQYSILMNSGESLWANGRQAFKSGDVGFDGGLWFDLPFHIDAFARYVIGLKDLNDIDNQDMWRSEQIQLGLGLRL